MSVVSRIAQFLEESFEKRLGSLNNGTVAHSHPFGEVRAMTKAAVLCLYRFSKKSQKPHCVALFIFRQED